MATEPATDGEGLHIESLHPRRRQPLLRSRPLATLFAFALSPAGKAVTRAWLALVVPTSLFYMCVRAAPLPPSSLARKISPARD